jgi:hypothetical protein
MQSMRNFTQIKHARAIKEEATNLLKGEEGNKLEEGKGGYKNLLSSRELARWLSL